MVNISIFIEGGIIPNDNDSARTIENSAKLRESFYTILSQVIPPDSFKLTIRLGGGIMKTINIFKLKIAKDKNSILLVDLDDFKNKKDKKIENFGLEKYKANVFFMVQEMEAWILSQIDKVDTFYRRRYVRKEETTSLSEFHKIKNTDFEKIRKPSIVLKEILGKYFRTQRDKKKKYGKLKDGAELLSILDAPELRKIFSDLNELVLTIKNTTN